MTRVEQLREAATPAEMRTEIARMRRHCHLVRSCSHAADIWGLSAEDRYTALAYEALKARASVYQALLDMMAVQPHPQLVVSAELAPTHGCGHMQGRGAA